MLRVPVPGRDDLWLEHLVLDVNGTLADRGELVAGVAEALDALRDDLALHILSADTFGTAEQLARRLRARFQRVETGSDKRIYVERLGATRCVGLGNGLNDAAMLEAAGLGVAVLGPEGAHAATIAAADVVVSSVVGALALLRDPQALTATLRP
jgi:P-type E1-E2 ATPase